MGWTWLWTLQETRQGRGRRGCRHCGRLGTDIDIAVAVDMRHTAKGRGHMPSSLKLLPRVHESQRCRSV